MTNGRPREYAQTAFYKDVTILNVDEFFYFNDTAMNHEIFIQNFVRNKIYKLYYKVLLYSFNKNWMTYW